MNEASTKSRHRNKRPYDRRAKPRSFAKGDYVHLHNSARNMRDEYVKELEAAVPKVLFSKGPIISRYTFVLLIPVIY